MSLPQQQQEADFDLTHILEELAKGRQWTCLLHLVGLAEGCSHLLPSARFDVVTVFKASTGASGTVYHLLQTSAAAAATAPQISEMLKESVAVGNSKFVEYLGALPNASNITAERVEDCCFDALQHPLGCIDDCHNQPNRRDPRMLFELTRLRGAAEIAPAALGKLLKRSVVSGGFCDVEALASLPAAVRVHADILEAMKADAAKSGDMALQHAVEKFEQSWIGVHQDARLYLTMSMSS